MNKGKRQKPSEQANTALNAKIKAKQEEINAWQQFYEDARALLSPIVSSPENHDLNQREILLRMIEKLIEKSEHPENTDKYKSLASLLEESEAQVRRLELQVSKMADELEDARTGHSQKRSLLVQKLVHLNDILAARIEEERQLLAAEEPTTTEKASLKREREALSLLSPKYREVFVNLS